MSVRATAALNSTPPEATVPRSKSNDGASIERSIFVFSRHFQWASRGYFCAPFPLTPALSLGERECCRPVLRRSQAPRLHKSLTAIPPLPKGEGWGEGERTVGAPGALELCGRPVRFVFMASVFCS